MSESEELVRKIANIMQDGKRTGGQRSREITKLLLDSGHIEPEPEDPWLEIRNRAVELRDLDGMATFVTVGLVLDRIISGWIPGLVALTVDECIALDYVLRLWEHETRHQLRTLLEHGEQAIKLPWATVSQMSKAQDEYRARLKLPAHPHGKCCNKYEEAHGDPMVLLASHG